MKVAYLSSYDAAGHRFNGMILHRALNLRGDRSDFYAMDQTLNEPRVHRLGGSRRRNLQRAMLHVERRLGLQATLAVMDGALPKCEGYRDADLVHLQLLHALSFISMKGVARIADGQRPVAWTLHDPWITTGHCVHSLGCERWRTGCGECPDLSIPIAVTRDRTAQNWSLKQRMLADANLHLIVASEWMRERVAQSPIIAHLPCSVIPFGVCQSIFTPRDRSVCRRRLGLPEDARVLALRWTPWNVLKGTQYAEEALLSLPPGVITHVLCIESDDGFKLGPLRERYEVRELGWIHDGLDIVLGAADVFVMPSVAETFGMMAVESMACGTPTIVFEGTSLPEIVDAPRAGLAVPHADSRALAEAIEAVMTDDRTRDTLVANGLALVAERYTEDRYIDEHLALYESLIGAG